MANIYDQHKAAFSNVSAYVILHNGERVATIAFKFPKDGAGRLYAYVHWIGIEMVRGYAGGYGYDKSSAAIESAVGAALKAHKDEILGHDLNRVSFYSALKDCDGHDWSEKLRARGFTVLQAV